MPSGTTLTVPDTTPPAAVSTLAAGATTETSVTLTWTAVGDDGEEGTASYYDLGYSTSPITDGNWNTATKVPGVPAPKPSGQPETYTVTGLAPGTTYYFALKVGDEVPNWSGLSNIASGATQPPADTTPPSAVTTLAMASTTESSATLTWIAVGDDGNVGTATTYDLRYATWPITDGNWNLTTPVAGLPKPKTAGQPETFTVTGLNPATTYYFALKVADEVPNWSGLSNVPSGTTLTPPDTTPPAQVTTLTAASSTDTTVTLTWTAVGDDGMTGTASNYDLRYSTGLITDGNWGASTKVSNLPQPKPSGQPEMFVVPGLTPGTTYYFGLKVGDKANNWSPLSNVPTGATQPAKDTTPPANVTTLAVGTATQTSLALSWTAVGDDGMKGTATAYDLRYSTAPITDGTWNSTTPVAGLPSPKPSGQPETFTVSGLSAGTAYYFALKVRDEVYNWSGLSNVPSGATVPSQDTTPPANVTTLAVTATTGTSVTLSWTAVGDDGNSGTATTYDLRRSSSVITDSTWSSNVPVSGLPVPKPAGQNESFTVSGLTPGTTYYFALKVADEVNNWSGLSNILCCATQPSPDTTPPAAVSTLAVTATTQVSATLTWTAVGDDRNTGQATVYDLRYSKGAITDDNWGTATPVQGLPAPLPSGQPETFTVTGLTPATTFYFALKVGDEVPNWSGLSNLPSGTTTMEDSGPLLSPGTPEVHWSDDGETLDVSWPPSADPQVVGYEVFGEDSNGTWRQLTNGPLAASHCEVSRTATSGLLYLAVKAVAAGDVESALSSPIAIPAELWSVEGPFPQPVTSACRFRINVPSTFPAQGNLRVEILDLLGHRLAVLFDGTVTPGTRLEVPWDRKISGKIAAPGYYYLRVESPTHRVLRTIYLAAT